MKGSTYSLVLVAVVATLAVLDYVCGHGMMMEPINRGSRWRVDRSAPVNYNDNGNFCGGFYVRTWRIV